MKLSGSLLVFFAAAGSALTARAATDYSRRNPAFAPAASIVSAVSRPESFPAIQEKRATLSPALVDKAPAALGDRRAPFVVSESREKKILPPEAQQLRPASHAPGLSLLNRQPARLSPEANVRSPALVAKYQDRLSTGNAVTIGRTPTLDHRGAARLNRFVFRHNPPAPLPMPAAAAAPRRAVPADER